MRREFGFLLSGALAVLTAQRAGAGECMGQGPWVSLEFVGDDWSGEFRGAVLNDLNAGLRARGLEACASTSVARVPAAASITIEREAAEEALSVEIKDSVTDKRVRRQIRLEGVPSDGRALALALAADELLWATWAELALDPSSEQLRNAPSEVRSGVHDALPRSPGRSFTLGLRGAAEAYQGGVQQYGADALFLPSLGEDWRLELGLGVRQGLTRPAPHGAVSSRGLGFRGTLRGVVLAKEALELSLGLGAHTQLIEFQGTPVPGATADSFAGVALHAHASGGALVPLSTWLALDLSAGVGYTVRRLEPLDEGQPTASVSGIVALAGLGVVVTP